MFTHSKHYCAITPTSDYYALAAIKQNKQSTIFTSFEENSLATLATKFKTYGLVLAVPDQYLEIHTCFCHPKDSEANIYQKIIRTLLPKCRTLWFDFERIEQTDNAEEQLVISYHLLDNDWLKPYYQLGFRFAALEPLSSAQKHDTEQNWQKQALESFHANTASYDLDAAILNLKLLNQAHFL